ncbi:MAG: eL32 family ribosomal protein [Anaerovoracaceae bacterium]
MRLHKRTWRLKRRCSWRLPSGYHSALRRGCTGQLQLPKVSFRERKLSQGT